jgi:excisionase family DNA binding protein
MLEGKTQPDAAKSANRPIGPRQSTSSPAEHRGRQRHPTTEANAAHRPLLTVSEAAQRLGIGRSLPYELLADGQVESIHVGRLRRIPTDALATYIDQQRTSTPSSAD